MPPYNYIYVNTAIIIVIIIFIVGLYKYWEEPNIENESYDVNEVYIKCNNGLYRKNNIDIANMLRKINVQLSSHNNLDRVNKYINKINKLNIHLKHFIDINPKKYNNSSDKAFIIDTVMKDNVKYNMKDINNRSKQLLSDDLESDNHPFELLLIYINIIINMLDNEICDNGVLNFTSIEQLTTDLNVDSGVCDINPELNISQSDDNHKIFDSQMTQIKGNSFSNQIRSFPKEIEYNNYNKDYSQRSQLFRESIVKLGDSHYNDEDLLYYS